MSSKKKKRFEAIKTMSNVLEMPKKTAGRWHAIFRNDHPIMLELACGKGEYTVEMARRFPQRNYIGVDIKGNRLWVGAKRAQELNLNNALFLRTLIEDIGNYFEKGEIADIWIVYPDPQLKRRKHKKRLTHPRFLRLYQKITSPHAHIHLKTDSPDLFKYSRQVLFLCNIKEQEVIEDAYRMVDTEKHLACIPTYYGSLDIAKSKKVFYLNFSLHQSKIPLSVDQRLNKLLGLSYSE